MISTLSSNIDANRDQNTSNIDHRHSIIPTIKINDVTPENVRKSKMYEYVRKTVIAANWIIDFAVPLTLIIMGGKYRDSCSENPHVPIWLIEWGIIFLSSSTVQLLGSVLFPKFDKKLIAGTRLTLLILTAAWSIKGGVLIFATNPIPKNCHPTLYTFSVTVTVITYICIALFIMIFIISRCLVKYAETRLKKEPQIEPPV